MPHSRPLFLPSSPVLTPTPQALLGIAASPDDSRDHPEAPLLSAGTRRENACRGLLHKALALCFQQGVEDDATEENLAALLALMQMAICECSPWCGGRVGADETRRRQLSNCMLSGACWGWGMVLMGNFRAQLTEKVEVAAPFGAQPLQGPARRRSNNGGEDPTQALFRSRHLRQSPPFSLPSHPTHTHQQRTQHGDSLTSSSSRKACLISDDDLRRYFDHVGIVVPNLPEMDLTPILANLFGTREKPLHEVLRTATHLLLCWTCACQRMFVRIVTRGLLPLDGRGGGEEEC